MSALITTIGVQSPVSAGGSTWKAAASSVAGSSYGPARAVDASAVTRWASASGGSQWLRIDMATSHDIGSVQLVWGPAYATAYVVQASANGSTWTSLYSTWNGNGGADMLTGLDGTGRYLRILLVKPKTPAGYSLTDVKVSGPAATADGVDLDDAAPKEIAMQLVSSAENSSLNWRAQYSYIEDIGDGRGYTGGIVGFCSGTSDMLELVRLYTARKPANGLATYLPALRKVDGGASHAGLGTAYVKAWKAAASDAVFRKAQDNLRDKLYFTPAVNRAKADGLQALGQFAYYDAAVMHGYDGMLSVRSAALRTAKTPAAGGSEKAYLTAFLNARVSEMRIERAHSDTTRVDTAQRVFLNAGNLTLTTPLAWKVYGDSFTIR